MGILSKDKGKQEVLPPETAVDTSKPISEVVTSTALAAPSKSNVPAEFLAEIDSGATGLENVTSRDLIIPRITILQALSPQLNRKKSEFIQGAEMGDFCDTALGDVYKEMILVPCYYATILLEWAPRETGKGLVANHGMNRDILKDCRKDEKQRNWHGDNLVSETATFYCLNITAGGRRVFVPLSSTNMKAARRWLTLITNERVLRADGSEFTPPIFYRGWKATKTEESNSQGDWFGWKFDPDQTIFELDPSKNLLLAAKEFMEQARSGLVSGDLASYADDGTSEGMRDVGGNTGDQGQAM